MDQLKKFDRLVSILIQLQSRKVIRAQDLADRFEVSLRTIYRDVQSLCAAGVPIWSEPGYGYSIMEGYRLPPVMFTREEAGSFVAAEKLMERFTDPSLMKRFQSAVYKVKSVLRSSEKDMMEVLENQIHTRGTKPHFNQAVPNSMELLLKSITDKKQLQLQYQSLNSSGPLERVIEPTGIFHELGFWYILAFCQLRQDYRQFRLDRIRQLKLLDVPFSRTHDNLNALLERKDESGSEKVVLQVHRAIVPHIERIRDYYGFREESGSGDWVEMTFYTRDLQEGFPRWFMSFADQARILRPAALAARVKELLDSSYRNLSGTPAERDSKSKPRARAEGL